MKNLLMTLVLVLFSLKGQSQPQLVGCWPLDNNYIDTAAWGHISNPVGTLLPALDRFGNVNKAMIFGQNNSIHVVNFPIPGTNGLPAPYTFVLWANLIGANLAGDDVLITIGGETNPPNNQTFGFTFAVKNNRLLIKGRNTHNYSVTDTSLFVPSNQWVMLSVVYNPVAIAPSLPWKFCVNNTIDSTNIFTSYTLFNTGLPQGYPYPLTTIPGATPLMRIGSVPPTYASPGEYFSGTLDDVRLYNYALSDSELLALYVPGMVGMNENNNNFKSSVYPNPTSDIITIKSETLFTNLLITDVAGRKIHDVIVNDTQSVVDVKTFKPGTYTVRLTDKNGARSQQKFVVN